MERYSEYKDSGVQWLGEIPSHWEILPGRIIFEENKKKNDGSDRNVLSLSYGNIVIKNDINEGLVPAEYSNYQIVEPGYIVVRCTDLQNDKVSLRTAISSYSGIITSAYLGLITKIGNNAFFMNYLLRAWDNCKELYRYGSGLRQSLSWNDFKYLLLPIPPRTEQDAIVSYLDSTISKIDTAISQQQKMIDLLNERKQIIINNAVTKGLDPNVKMKDSGVDWIGEIPEGWDVRKAKLCVTISNGSDPKLEGDIPVYGSGSSSFRTCGEYKEGPCVLIGRKGATLHIPHYIEGRYWNVDTAFDVKAKDGILLKFYYYLATCFDYQFYMSQTTLPSMTSFDYNRMKLPLPPINEQKEILENLEKKLCFFNNAISSIEKQITLLQERKQIIINDVVTGKVS